MKNAIGMVAVSGFGKNILGTGFFISDKLFCTDFLTVDQLRRDSRMNIAIWIKNQYFAVKKTYALHGARNIAILEIESSYKGGVLKLSEEETPTNVMYGAGFDIIQMYNRGHYMNGEEIFRGLTNKKASRVSTESLLNIMEVRRYQSLSGYQFFQLRSGRGMYLSTNGLPFVDQNGDVIGMKFGNILNLAYATPVKFLKEVLRGKGNCGELSIEDCLDKSVEDLYEEAKSGDPIAQYAHNDRMYVAYLDEAILRGNEAIDLLWASAETGNVLSQLQTMIHITSQYRCFATIEENYTFWSLMGDLLGAMNRLVDDEKEVVELTLKWLDEMEKKDFVFAYYLKGTMFINGNCVEKDVRRGFSYLEQARQKGFAPLD